MDIVKRLRLEIGGYTDDYLEKAEADMKEAADEIERLRQQVAELVKALQTINKWQPSSKTQPRQKIIDSMQFYAHLSIAKATGGE